MKKQTLAKRGVLIGAVAMLSLLSVWGCGKEENEGEEPGTETKEVLDEKETGEAAVAEEEKTAEEIKRVYEKTGYVLDTHTAVASAVYHDYKMKTQDDTKTIIASTASPYKFATSVMTAIDKKYEGMDDFALIDELSKTAGTKIPNAVEEIRSAPVLHDTVCDTKDMQKMVEKILGI